MILVDMCVPRKFLRLLHEWGYDASSVDELLTADAPDASVIAMAQAVDAVLLTVDMDFSNILDYPPDDYNGIVIMRYVIKDEKALQQTLKQTLEELYQDKLRHSLVIVEPNRYRLRR